MKSRLAVLVVLATLSTACVGGKPLPLPPSTSVCQRQYLKDFRPIKEACARLYLQDLERGCKESGNGESEDCQSYILYASEVCGSVLEEQTTSVCDLYYQWTISGWPDELTVGLAEEPSQPEGQIAYLSGGPPDWSSIVVVNVDGSGRRTLEEGEITNMAWSPDGGKIAYVVHGHLVAPDFETTTAEILLLDVDSSMTSEVIVPAESTRCIRPCHYWEFFDYKNPRWSPDGNSLYYLAWDSYEEKTIRKVSLGQSGYSIITQDWYEDNGGPLPIGGFDISVNGELVYVVTFEDNTLTQDALYAHPVDVALKDAGDAFWQPYVPHYLDSVGICCPTWSPDGTKIVFVAQGGRHFGERGIFVVERGSAPRRLTTGEDHGPSWAPDGRWIVFERFSKETNDLDVWIVSGDGKTLMNLTNSPEVWERFPAWRP